MRYTDPELEAGALGMRMPNGQCRMHGWRLSRRPRGKDNGMWRHGLRSIEVIQRRRMMIAKMRRIRREMPAEIPFSIADPRVRPYLTE
jgi:hypothetical protein